MSGRGAFPAGPGPLALAHRGGAAEAPENSASAFQNAVDLGVRCIETDVRATADGHAVIFHDATIDRTSSGTGPIAGITLADLRRTHLADGAPPMTLAEALRRWPDTVLNVDVKCDDAVGPFLSAVSDCQAWGRVCAASFSATRLELLRELAGPRLATSMHPREVTRLVLGLDPGDSPVAAQVPRRSGPIPVVTRRFVRAAHRRGVQVHVWVVDDAQEMRELLDLGVDGLVTDRPSLLREVLADRGAWA